MNLCELCDRPLIPPPSRADWRRCYACTMSPKHSRVRGQAPGYASTGELTFTVPGSPLSVNRVNRMGVTSQGRRLMYYSAEGKRYKYSVAMHALAVRPSDWRLDARYEVEIVSYFATDRSDADNSVKPALDALQGVLFDNDKQVVSVHVTKALDPAAPRLVVTVRAVP